jgi:DNA replication protein DnaC
MNPSSPSTKSATVAFFEKRTKRWHDLIGEPTYADAILDRILHTAYRIELRGKSMRGPRLDESVD